MAARKILTSEFFAKPPFRWLGMRCRWEMGQTAGSDGSFGKSERAIGKHPKCYPLADLPLRATGCESAARAAFEAPARAATGLAGLPSLSRLRRSISLRS